MSYISCLHLIFGNLFVLRTLEIFRTRSRLSTKFLTKIGTTSLTASVLSAFFLIERGFLCSISLFTIEIITILALILYERRQIDAIKEKIPAFLDQWILNLKLGMGLSGSRDTSLKAQTIEFQSLMSPLFASQNVNQLRKSHPILSVAMIKELADIAREPHLALTRLENLRNLFRKSTDFRRRSGHAIRQTQIQCAVMLALQFALSIFTIRRFGWRNCGDLVILSAFLAILGVVSMKFLAKKRKWKI